MRCEACCRGPLPALIGSVCAPCYFAEIVRDDQTNLGSFIERCSEAGLCVYCGETATQRDHVIPQAWSLPTYTVPACADCNNRCSDALCSGLRDKRSLVSTILRRTYTKVLRMPEWDADELEELSYSLRTRVLAGMQAKAVISSRIDFAELSF